MVNNNDKKGTNIVLVGFMGTGKTSVGIELSKQLDLRLIDIDRLIEEKTKMTITDIFEKYGEKHFRQVEKETIKEVSQLQNIIISCGGGACLDPENVSNIKKTGRVVLLEAKPEDIVDRIGMDTSRPLLKDKNDVEGIKKIMDARQESYHKSADIIINTSGRSISSVRDEIIRQLS